MFLLGRICLSFGMKDIWIRKGEEFVFHQVDEGHLGGESRGEGNVFRQKVERHLERGQTELHHSTILHTHYKIFT